jgi:superfamily I DNA and RNA helicase
VNLETEYDYVLIDEGQDFPSEFYQLCFYLARGERDRKNVIWAYDELQNILNVHIPRSEELFGYDEHGEPRISLDRSARHLPAGVENDIVLSKCYRNQREVLVIAHALGFGVYGHAVQMLEDEQHWEDVGYHVENPPLEVGDEAVILRPPENSPLDLNDPSGDRLIHYEVFDRLGEEVNFVAREIRKFLAQGLKPEDILVVSLDDRNARTYFKGISSKLGESGISTNNIIADPYSEPPFLIEERVTLSTVYRAKGNEAAVVFAVGIDALNRKLRGARNRIFTTFTRSKAWLRVSGLGDNAKMFGEEIREAKENFPYLRFPMPDRKNIETIQRDMSEKVAKAKEIKEKYAQELRELGLTEEEIGGLINLAL